MPFGLKRNVGIAAILLVLAVLVGSCFYVDSATTAIGALTRTELFERRVVFLYRRFVFLLNPDREGTRAIGENADKIFDEGMRKDYPIGSSEKRLLEDFPSWKRGEFSPSAGSKWEKKCKSVKQLMQPGGLIDGALTIEWCADEKGNITEIAGKYKCGLTTLCDDWEDF